MGGGDKVKVVVFSGILTAEARFQSLTQHYEAVQTEDLNLTFQLQIRSSAD